MKINGIGNVTKAEMMSILTSEGREAVKDGTMTMEELAHEYKLEQIRKASRIGSNGDTFSDCLRNVPSGVIEKCTPAEVAELVDNFYPNRKGNE